MPARDRLLDPAVDAVSDFRFAVPLLLTQVCQDGCSFDSFEVASVPSLLDLAPSSWFQIREQRGQERAPERTTIPLELEGG